MKNKYLNNKRWFVSLGLAGFALILIGVAVPTSFTAPQAITVRAEVADQSCRGGDGVLVRLTAMVMPDQQARFRWDFNNDGVFDTQPSTNPTVTHIYPDEATVTARVRASNRARERATDSVTFATLRCGG